MNTNPNKNTEEEEYIDYFTFDAFELAEDLHDIMPSLRAEYGHLATEAEENGEIEKAAILIQKAKEIHKIYEGLQVNKDKEFVKIELEKYSLELNTLHGFGK